MLYLTSDSTNGTTSIEGRNLLRCSGEFSNGSKKNTTKENNNSVNRKKNYWRQFIIFKYIDV